MARECSIVGEIATSIFKLKINELDYMIPLGNCVVKIEMTNNRLSFLKESEWLL